MFLETIMSMAIQMQQLIASKFYEDKLIVLDKGRKKLRLRKNGEKKLKL
jgi:hypothetical protein